MESATAQIKIHILNICACRLQLKYIFLKLFDGARLGKNLAHTITLRALQSSSKEPRFFDWWSPRGLPDLHANLWARG